MSDDRSLRLWRLDLINQTYQPLSEFYGHRSRVWRLSELGYKGMLVTVSEDATCKVWEVPNEEEKTNVVVNRSIETLKGHLGRNIRALSSYEGLIATGGDDGGIKVWNAREILDKKSQAHGEEAKSETLINHISFPLPQYESAV